jgi:hypothetical protein
MATSPSLPNIQTYPLWQAVNQQNGNVMYTLEVAQVQVSAAQMNLLRTTPIQLTPTPSIYQCLWVDTYSVRLDYGGTAYTLNGGNLKLFYGPVTNLNPLTSDLSAILTQTASAISINGPILFVGPASFATTQQMPIYIGNSGGANYSLGNSPVTFTVFFGRTTP